MSGCLPRLRPPSRRNSFCVLFCDIHPLPVCNATLNKKMDLRRRPSVTSRLSFAVSNAESGEVVDEPTDAAHRQIEEEIAEIKRYEVS